MKLLPLFIGALMAGLILTPLPGVASYAELGGSLEDYQPVVDARTDLPAKAGNTTRLLAAQMSRTTPLAYVTFGAVSGDPPTLGNWVAVWGLSPAPTVDRIEPAPGEYLVTFPASVTVEGVNVSLNLKFAIVSWTKIGWMATAKVLSPNTVQVKFKQDDGVSTADPGPGESITLMVR
jgi:hypothetical protein